MELKSQEKTELRAQEIKGKKKKEVEAETNESDWDE